MNTPLRRRPGAVAIVMIGILSAMLAASVACLPPASRRQDSAASAPGQQPQNVNHLVPPRDFVGPAPKEFRWTAIPGADSYSIGIYNEVDMMIWRMNNVPTTSVARPDDLTLEPGTYFWLVSALKDGEQIAESGLAAFVVRTIP